MIKKWAESRASRNEKVSCKPNSALFHRFAQRHRGAAGRTRFDLGQLRRTQVCLEFPKSCKQTGWHVQPKPQAMRISYITVLVTALAALPSAPVGAVSEAQFETIRSLGVLNGVALHCQYLDETRRMKAALVETLPKRRELGLAFDEMTNESFIKFIEEGLTCPDSAKFTDQVDSAIEALKKAF